MAEKTIEERVKQLENGAVFRSVAIITLIIVVSYIMAYRLD